MYLVLLLLLGLAGLSQQHCRHHHGHHKAGRVPHLIDYHSRLFEDTANEVIALDKKSQRLCEAHSNSATKEILEKKRYTLKVPLEDFTMEEIKVEVRHRVVYINAFKANPEKHYSEVRVLPPMVNVSDARFNYEDGILEVVFPTENTISHSCNPNINDEVINVPKLDIFAPGGGAQARFGLDDNDETTSTLKGRE